MNQNPPRDANDDGAPLDYTSVSSVSEGVRRRQAQPMRGKSPAQPADFYGRRRTVRAQRLPADGVAVTSRAEPQPSSPVDYGIPENPFAPPPETQQRRRTRTARPDDTANGQGMAGQGDEARPFVGYAPGGAGQAGAAQPAASAAMRPPAGGSPYAAQTAERQSPYAAQQSMSDNAQRQIAGSPPAPSRAMTGARIAMPSQPQVFVAQDGSQFEAPARPDVPEWLRVAQQNNMPVRRPEGPRVTAAPLHEDAPVQTDVLGRPLHSGAHRRVPPVNRYAEAGYPPELLQEQERMEHEQAAQPVRRRHGAQFAVNPYAPQRPQAQNAPVQRPMAHGVAQRPAAPLSPEGLAQRARAYADSSGGADRPWMHPTSDASYDLQGDPSSASTPLSPEGLAQRARAYADSSGGADRPWMHPTSDASYDPQGEPAPDPSAPPARFDRAQRAPADEAVPPAEPRARSRVPWLGIAVFTAAAIAVALWLTQLSFQRQTREVLDARQAVQEAIEQAHPFRYESLIEEKANKYNLSPAFVAAIVLNESSFRPDATSSVGARGLMQLVDETASWVHRKMDLPTAYSFDNLYDPETNVEYGCWYLNFLSRRFRGDPILVAAAYHAGQGEVQNWLNDSRYSADNLTIALENMMDGPTKQYTTRVLNAYAVYKRLYYPSTEDIS